MSSAFVAKLTEVLYVLIPIAIIISGIIFWESSQKKIEAKDEK